MLEHTLPQYGITTTFVDIFNEEEVEAAFQENTKALFIETLGNPNSDVVDVEKYAKIAHLHFLQYAKFAHLRFLLYAKIYVPALYYAWERPTNTSVAIRASTENREFTVPRAFACTRRV